MLRPLLWLLLLLLADVTWRHLLGLPQGAAGARQPRPTALDTSAMFLVQCSDAAAFLKGQTLFVMEMLDNQTSTGTDGLIFKVKPQNVMECENGLAYNRTALVTRERGNITLHVLLDNFNSSAGPICQYAFQAGAVVTRSAVVTAVNVTSFHVCRSGRCGESGRPSSSCGPGQKSPDCPEGQGWVVERRVQGNWTSLRPVKRPCGLDVTMQDALLVEHEDQVRLAGRAVDARDGDEYRAVYVHPNGTCELCVLDSAHVTHAPLFGLSQSTHLVLALSVIVGVLLVIIVVLVVVIVCLYLRRGRQSRLPWWCVLKRSRPVPECEAPCVVSWTDLGPQAGRDETESADLIVLHSDSASNSNSNSSSSNRKTNSDDANFN